VGERESDQGENGHSCMHTYIHLNIHASDYASLSKYVSRQISILSLTHTHTHTHKDLRMAECNGAAMRGEAACGDKHMDHDRLLLFCAAISLTHAHSHEHQNSRLP